jgi:hypothetical protein
MLPGTDPARAKDALVVVAHYDSRGRDPLDAAGDAPGAVDNASGVALVLEMATVLGATTPAVSIYFVATAGGAQGLLGSKRLAARLKTEGIDIIGMAAADCVGNVLAADGSKSGGAMRLFSDGVPAQETEGQKRVRELLGTENDGASRELARYLKHAGDRFVEGLDCLVMLRRDRLGSDGEQTVFTGKGIPGVRVTELVDPFERLGQGTSPGKLSGDTATFFDPGYCARITRMMVAGFRQLSYAPAGPQNVGLGSSLRAGRLRHQRHETLVDPAGGPQDRRHRALPQARGRGPVAAEPRRRQERKPGHPGGQRRHRRLRRGHRGHPGQRIPAGVAPEHCVLS